ncbi:hypothetical protein JHK87_023148 [Glycine soja]|nr:hypothetical protein JHK87_023148 [Glycine soja]
MFFHMHWSGIEPMITCLRDKVIYQPCHTILVPQTLFETDCQKLHVLWQTRNRHDRSYSYVAQILRDCMSLRQRGRF